MKLYACRTCGLPSPERYCPEHRQNGSRNGSTRQWRKLRARVLERDRHICQLGLPGCTETATHVDHVKPRSQGGTDDLDNLQAACQRCNLTKGDT